VKKLFSLFLIVLFTAAMMQAQDMTDLKNKLQMMNDEFARKMVAGDMESMWGYYSDDVISMPSYEPMLKGIEACKESAKKMEESGMKMTAFKMTVTDIIQSGNLVIDIGTYELTMTMPQMGDMPWDDNGKYITVWEIQDDGSMKVKVETWNTDVNPWEEMQKMQAPGEGHEGQQH